MEVLYLLSFLFCIVPVKPTTRRNANFTSLVEKVLTCNPSEFLCLNGEKCITTEWKCDGRYDCFDHTDEVNCTYICNSNEFHCWNGNCIDMQWICDGKNDCGDGSDERPATCPSPKCEDSSFKCDQQGTCIAQKWVCDGFPDCPNSTDESKDVCSTVNKTECPQNSFQCKSGLKCIPKTAQCDNTINCVDGSDEQNCSTYDTCSGMKCLDNNKACVTPEKLCDGTYDCMNGEDETECDSKNKEGLFRCGPTHQNIEEKLVCNGHTDCQNGADEAPLCNVNECESNNGECGQICVDLTIGHRCYCYAGYELKEDEKSCEDRNECLISGICSQHCENTAGSYQCSCYPGYVLVDQRFCKALGPHFFLLFADQTSIRTLDIRGRVFYRSVANGAQHATGVSFLAEKDFVYWSDIAEHKIYRSILGQRDSQEILVKGVARPVGIVVDWLSKKLYWTEEKKNTISVSELDGRDKTVLISNLDQPKCVAVDSRDNHRFIYWTEWGPYGNIQRISMDGDQSSRLTIFRRNNSWPEGLVVDTSINRIFFVDSNIRTIESCTLLGTDHKVLQSNNSRVWPHSVAVFEDFLYWTDWSTQSISRMNKFLGGTIEVLQTGLTKPSGIVVYHPLLQQGASNPCMESFCSHLCLFSHHHGYSCACPSGFILLEDQKTCNTTDAYFCSRDFCMHGGTCYNTSRSGEKLLRRCQKKLLHKTLTSKISCRLGFGGDRCEKRVEIRKLYNINGKTHYLCVDNYCLHGGWCSNFHGVNRTLRDKAICRCRYGFYGERCEHNYEYLLVAEHDQSGEDDRKEFYEILKICLSSTVGALLVLLIIALAMYYFKKPPSPRIVSTIRNPVYVQTTTTGQEQQQHSRRSRMRWRPRVG